VKSDRVGKPPTKEMDHNILDSAAQMVKHVGSEFADGHDSYQGLVGVRAASGVAVSDLGQGPTIMFDSISL
jgi:hypothetical protein